jgi:hypothetical protein
MYRLPVKLRKTVFLKNAIKVDTKAIFTNKID